MIQQVDTALYDKLSAKLELALMQCTDEKLKALRSKAFDKFKQNGFPTVKNEEWKQTNVQPLLKNDYDLNVVPYDISKAQYADTATLIAKHSDEILQSLKGEHKGAYRLVLVNGIINTQHSYLPDGNKIKVQSFDEAQNEISFQKHFGNIATIEKNAFAALNTALFTDGIFIEIAKDYVADKPLHIIHVYLSECDIWIQPRSLFVVNKNASLDVIETIITDEKPFAIFANSVAEIFVDDNAFFHHYDIQTGRDGLRLVQRTEAKQAQHSNYSNYTFTFPGAEFVRNNLSIHLEDKNLESHLYGLYLSSGRQLVDNHTEVHHKFPNGESNQLYKGILLDESKAVFNGKIFVYQDAQKTNAFQQSNNLLFSDKATVNAKPQLEIFADDVKCSHGTTIGQMDKEALFYLQSRGIGEASAKTMMMQAFAFDVTEKVKNPALKSYLEKEIQKVMSGAYHK